MNKRRVARKQEREADAAEEADHEQVNTLLERIQALEIGSPELSTLLKANQAQVKQWLAKYPEDEEVVSLDKVFTARVEGVRAEARSDAFLKQTYAGRVNVEQPDALSRLEQLQSDLQRWKRDPLVGLDAEEPLSDLQEALATLEQQKQAAQQAKEKPRPAAGPQSEPPPSGKPEAPPSTAPEPKPGPSEYQFVKPEPKSEDEKRAAEEARALFQSIDSDGLLYLSAGEGEVDSALVPNQEVSRRIAEIQPKVADWRARYPDNLDFRSLEMSKVLGPIGELRHKGGFALEFMRRKVEKIKGAATVAEAQYALREWSRNPLVGLESPEPVAGLGELRAAIEQARDQKNQA